MEETMQSIKRSRKPAEAIALAAMLADSVDAEFSEEEIEDWDIHDVYDYISEFGYEWDDYLGWTK